MHKRLIIFPDTTAICNFIFSRRLIGAEANTKELTVTAQMEDDDVIEAVANYKGHLSEKWLSLPKPKC